MQQITKLSILFLIVTSLFLSTGCGNQKTESSEPEYKWAKQMIELKKFIENNESSTYISKLFRRADKPGSVSYNLENMDTLYLITTDGGDGPGYDHAVWGNPLLTDKDGNVTKLSDLKPLYSKFGWGSLLVNKNFSGKKISVADTKYDYALISHSTSIMKYYIGKKYVKFESQIGVDNGATNRASVEFVISNIDIYNFYTSLIKKFPETRYLVRNYGGTSKFLKWIESKNDDGFYNKSIDFLTKHINRKGFKLVNTKAETTLDKLKLIEDLLMINKNIPVFNNINFESLQSAMNDLNKNFTHEFNYNEYSSKLENFKSELKAYTETLKNGTISDFAKMTEYVSIFNSLKDEILKSNPLLLENKLIFIVRKQYAKDHHNTATLFHTNEVNTDSFTPGGAMKILDIKSGKIKTLIETKTGIVRDPEMSFDGKKIVFSMREDIKDDYSIYEYDLLKNSYKALTKAKGVSDIDPLYLPDGQIVFTSTREPKYCMCNVHIMGNLFKMNSDGSNVHQIGKSSLFEGHSTLLPDGRILYDRWEYVDRNFGDAQGLWTVNPDGTNHAIYFGNNTNSPGGVIDARAIPGTQKVLCVLGSCHDRAWGALAILDNRNAVDGKKAVVRTWPKEAMNRIGKGNWDAFMGLRKNYEDPYPLNDKYFLCSRTTGVGEKMGIYLVDIFGNETLIHTEGEGCYDPIPITTRNNPGEIVNRRKFDNRNGKFYVADVYEGTHMKGVKRGDVKFLRVVQSIEKKTWTVPAWSGQGVHRPAMNWHGFECKKILGTVPVEEDGSVFFEAPSDTFVYFQLLDKDGKMIQSMRSGTMVQPGETLGCIGCHDDRRATPPVKKYSTPMALTKSARKLDKWYGEPRQFGFMNEVQPIFNKHCVSCHDFGKKAGKKLNLAGDRNVFFNASYIDLWLKKYIKCVGGGPAEIQQARSWGSSQSKLIQVIEKGHANVKLSKEEMDKLYTWIDLNGVYYPTFASSYPDNPVGRSPLTEAEVKRISKLTNVNILSQMGHYRNKRAMLSFERPHVSPVLKTLNKNSKEYKEVVEIISKGFDRLKEKPRADMKNQVISAKDMERLNKYANRKDIETKNREAIKKGIKLYDK